MFDLIIKGGVVAGKDKSGNDIRDVVIQDDMIVDCCQNTPSSAHSELDATGCWVLPGFVDVHSHTDEAALRPYAWSKILQGITTEICGQCGGAPAPFSSQASRSHREAIKREEDGWYPHQLWQTYEEFLMLLERGIPTNLIVFAGWWTICDDAMRFGSGRFDGALNSACRILEQGAAGLSIHQESNSWRTLAPDQKKAVFSAVGAVNGIVSVHMERYDYSFLTAMQELQDLSAETNTRLQISHVKIQGDRQDLLRPEICNVLSSPNLRFDITPYTSLCTRARMFLARIHSYSYKISEFSSVYSLSKPWKVQASETGWGPELQQYLRLRLAEDPDALIVADGLRDEDVDVLLSHKSCFVGTDAAAFPRDFRTRAHPRAFEGFPVALERRLRNGATAANIADQFSFFPAQWFGLRGRGRVEPGWHADLVVLVPGKQTVVRDVVINGKLVVRNGQVIMSRAGRPLVRHPSSEDSQ